MEEVISEQCRTCLINLPDMVMLDADHVVCDRVMSVLDLLKICCSAEIELNDGFTQYVCLECIRSAEKSYEFRIQCENADQTLRSQSEEIKELVLSEDSETLKENEVEIESENENNIEYEILKDEYKGIDDKEIIYEENSVEISEADESSEDINCLQILDSNTTEIKCENIEIIQAYSCSVCKLIFPTPIALSRHTAVTHFPNFFQCPLCSVRFISHNLLEQHLLKHNSNKKDEIRKSNCNRKKMKRKKEFVCSVCGNIYNSIKGLRMHFRKHEEKKESKNDPKYELINCDDYEETSTKDKVETTAETLKIKNFDKSKTDSSGLHRMLYKCKICSEEDATLTLMKEHITKTHNIETKILFQYVLYKCFQCQKDCSSIYEYFEHLGNNLKSSIGSTVKVKKRPYKCSKPDCEKAFPTPSALRTHSKTHESPWPKKCRYCDDIFNKLNEYLMHLNKNHDDHKKFVCSQCGKKFFNERNLKTHMLTHSGERNYVCDFCGYSFHAQNNLASHRRIHQGIKPYKCTYCPQAFSQYAGLRSHLLNHTGERKYECQTCHKKFLRLGALNSHIKTHTGQKDYVCHVCGASFGASSTRKKHLLTHTGERNYVCSYCGRPFSRKSNLTVHTKIHTGETPHVCELCGKGFIQKHVLRSHMETHRKQSGKKSPKKNVKKKISNSEEKTETLTVLVEIPE